MSNGGNDRGNSDDRSGMGGLSPTVLARLDDQRRLYALVCLQEIGSSMYLGELADAVAARERGTRSDRIPLEGRRHVERTLRREHVPALERAGLVTYEDDRDLVDLSPDAEDDVWALVESLFGS